MLQIEDTIVSLDLLDQYFICDLESCRGACCVEGEEGAPVEVDEIAELEEVLPAIWNEMTEDARRIVDNQGVAYIDREGDLAVSIVNGAECVFACKERDGKWSCLVEKAFLAGKSSFRKPVSCHLYPVRVKQLSSYRAVNYHRWTVCKCAVVLGNKERLPLYRFLEEPLIRKFGQEWYNQLVAAAAYVAANGINLK
jgi:hypothetical protein